MMRETRAFLFAWQTLAPSGLFHAQALALHREVLAGLMKEEGFEVIECTTAEAAELIIATTGSELRAVVTDNNLAGTMSGAALASYARDRNPGMRIVIMSGSIVEPMPANTTFLHKPFAPERLLEVVRH
jgi:DNA-binding NtrC family response regulator